MNIPSLPTDNLYKFISILGLLLLILASILIFRIPGIPFESYTSTFSIILIIFGLLISSFGFYFWFNKTQKNQDLVLEHETDKYLHEQTLKIRSVQFELEYRIYQTLWKELYSLRKSIGDVTLSIQNAVFEKKVTNVPIFKEDDPFVKAINGFHDQFEENRPFIPSDIYEVSEKISNICYHFLAEQSLTDVYILGNIEPDFESKFSELKIIIEDLCNKIRNRIKITEEI
jgi:hypothetical protein